MIILRQGCIFSLFVVMKIKIVLVKLCNGKMILNAAGEMIEKWYYELENKFPDIKCDEMIIMPNHFHCIVQNIGIQSTTPVGADLRVCPNDISGEHTILGQHVILGEHVILG